MGTVLYADADSEKIGLEPGWQKLLLMPDGITNLTTNKRALRDLQERKRQRAVPLEQTGHDFTNSQPRVDEDALLLARNRGNFLSGEVLCPL